MTTSKSAEVSRGLVLRERPPDFTREEKAGLWLLVAAYVWFAVSLAVNLTTPYWLGLQFLAFMLIAAGRRNRVPALVLLGVGSFLAILRPSIIADAQPHGEADIAEALTASFFVILNGVAAGYLTRPWIDDSGMVARATLAVMSGTLLFYLAMGKQVTPATAFLFLAFVQAYAAWICVTQLLGWNIRFTQAIHNLTWQETKRKDE